MNFLHSKSNSASIIHQSQINAKTIFFHQCICHKVDNYFFIKGHLGTVKIFLNPIAYISHTYNSLTINSNQFSPQSLALLQRIQKGISVGFSQRIFHSGVWTIMQRNRQQIQFHLGFVNPINFNLPKHVLFKSRREGQFRTINLLSISYPLLKDTAANLVKLQPADPYRLNGFRYALSSALEGTYVSQKTSLIGTKTKIGKKK